MGSRWYNPAVGRFHNKDTQAFAPSRTPPPARSPAWDDDPLTRTDPTGHLVGRYLARDEVRGLHHLACCHLGGVSGLEHGALER
ncbi:hypothetical protein GCM10023196_086480 [Actinoallomurus vinaceus]|uniref:Uncharacterized protein n=1 Tax=Actinoallomurus vinaceus TaxID=1080074 RepID=A0ABP8UR19_9ACTN